MLKPLSHEVAGAGMWVSGGSSEVNNQNLNLCAGTAPQCLQETLLCRLVPVPSGYHSHFISRDQGLRVVTYSER